MPAEKDVKLEARLTVIDPGNTTTVRRFEHAWAMANDLADAGLRPITIRLDGFVRKDSPKDEFVIRV